MGSSLMAALAEIDLAEVAEAERFQPGDRVRVRGQSGDRIVASGPMVLRSESAHFGTAEPYYNLSRSDGVIEFVAASALSPTATTLLTRKFGIRMEVPMCTT